MFGTRKSGIEKELQVFQQLAVLHPHSVMREKIGRTRVGKFVGQNKDKEITYQVLLRGNHALTPKLLLCR